MNSVVPLSQYRIEYICLYVGLQSRGGDDPLSPLRSIGGGLRPYPPSPGLIMFGVKGRFYNDPYYNFQCFSGNIQYVYYIQGRIQGAAK